MCPNHELSESQGIKHSRKTRNRAQKIIRIRSIPNYASPNYRSIPVFESGKHIVYMTVHQSKTDSHERTRYLSRWTEYWVPHLE